MQPLSNYRLPSLNGLTRSSVNKHCQLFLLNRVICGIKLNQVIIFSRKSPISTDGLEGNWRCN